VNRWRSFVFAIVFYGGSVPFVLGVPLAALGGQRAMIRYAHAWAGFGLLCARALLGITYRIEGERPVVPVLYAAKHQSMYETLLLAIELGGPAVVLKRELRRIPLWGWATERYGAIVADRDASAAALRRMMKDARAAAAGGRSVLIFPEGTRVALGEAPPLQSGFAGLYRAIGLPVVPIALDSGRVWPRRGPKRPGVVTVRLGEAVPPGLARAEVEGRVHAAINALG
jgi:1-acyl-sn-glycerol-3-phosphate acyltransferase